MSEPQEPKDASQHQRLCGRCHHSYPLHGNGGGCRVRKCECTGWASGNITFAGAGVAQANASAP